MKTKIIILYSFILAAGCANSNVTTQNAVEIPIELINSITTLNDNLILKISDLYPRDRKDFDCRLIIDSYYESIQTDNKPIKNYKANHEFVLSTLLNFITKDSTKTESELEDIKSIYAVKDEENAPSKDAKNKLFYNAVFNYLVSARTDELTRLQVLSPLVHKDKKLDNGKRELIIYATSPLSSEFAEIEIRIHNSIFKKEDLIADSLYYGGVRYIIEENEGIDTLAIEVRSSNKLTGEVTLTKRKYVLN